MQDRYAQLRVQEEELKRVVDRLEAQRAAAMQEKAALEEPKIPLLLIVEIILL